MFCFLPIEARGFEVGTLVEENPLGIFVRFPFLACLFFFLLEALWFRHLIWYTVGTPQLERIPAIFYYSACGRINHWNRPETNDSS